MDYLSIPLAKRAEMRAKDPGNFAKYPAAYGGIWTREGDGSRFSSRPGMRGLYCWVGDTDSIGRFVGASDKIISRLGHNGWFVNSHQDQTTRGVVYRLPHGRFLAGASDPWQAEKDGSGPWLCDDSVYESEEEAARAADRVAELYAESCREDDAKQTAEIRIESAQEEIASLRDQARELIAGIRESVLAPAVCAQMRRDLKRLRREIASEWRTIRRMRENYWNSVENA